jgi:hypothetical protein
MQKGRFAPAFFVDADGNRANKPGRPAANAR